MSLHLKIQYSGSNWIFMDEAIVLVNNKKFDFYIGNTNRNVSTSAIVYERSDVLVNENLLIMLRELANSSKAADLRLIGDYYKDIKINKNVREKIKHILELYDLLLITGE